MFKRDKKLKKQIFILITITFLFISGITLYLDYLDHKDIYTSKVSSTINEAYVIMEAKQNEIRKSYVARAEYFLKDKNVIDAIKKETVKNYMI